MAAQSQRDKIDAAVAGLPAPKVAAGGETPGVDAYVSNAVALADERVRRWPIHTPT